MPGWPRSCWQSLGRNSNAAVVLLYIQRGSHPPPGQYLMDLFYRRFAESARRVPDAVAVEMQRRDHTETLTYAELHHMAESVGAGLRENGIAARSRCAIF